MPARINQSHLERNKETKKYDGKDIAHVLKLLKKYRERLGISAQEVENRGKELFGEEKFPSHKAVSMYENLHRTPDVLSFLRLCAVYGITDISAFLYSDPEAEKKLHEYSGKILEELENIKTKAPELKSFIVESIKNLQNKQGKGLSVSEDTLLMMLEDPDVALSQEETLAKLVIKCAPSIELRLKLISELTENLSREMAERQKEMEKAMRKTVTEEMIQKLKD